MSLTQEQVQRIAHLARIALGEAEAASTRTHLDGIFGLIEQMQSIDTTGIEPMAHAQDVCQRLREEAPAEIGGEKLAEISTMDGVKYIMADDSWLLIRPSGTEAVLRVYAEGRSQEMVKALLQYGENFAASIV